MTITDVHRHDCLSFFFLLAIFVFQIPTLMAAPSADTESL